VSSAVPFPLLRSDQVHLWQVHLDPAAEEESRRMAVVNAAERERARHLRSGRHACRFLNAHGALRLILGGYLSVHPTSLRFGVRPNGKPHLEEDSLEFSLSHTGSLALVGVARDRRVGVDVEKIRPLPDLDALASRFFTREEYAALLALPEGAREGAFFAIWTRKEAFVKATGEGISALGTFEVSVSPPARLVHRRGERSVAERWSLVDLGDIAGHAACLAAEGVDWQLVPQSGTP